MLGLFDVAQAFHPLIFFYCSNASADLGRALQHKQHSRDRYECLEEIDLDSGWAVPTYFFIAPAICGNLRPVPKQSEHPGEEEQDV